ncbi:SDR family NAD(P)-dependent oxidoreductase [Cerasicoccus arenae]|uniref:D-threitol dehydrogenase n=1 Tax=Cerasicoccus arenae TaxID=424488 RepID=A0A8J3DDG1_9BACT|nr:SDR family oxidoreductase [Cerasicoccus arenae]MBK1860041.1 SDR family oxidoreductase [Cerasicoccus arenae]GHC14000.1 D-threitol dehydrogenase [Cerasicoccus arenae]
MSIRNQSLIGKRALITGAGEGLGRGISKAFAEQGASVAVCSLNGEEAEVTATICAEYGVKTYAAGFDLLDDSATLDFAAESARQLGGPIDLFVHNAAVMPVYPIDSMPMAQLDMALNLNLRVGALLTQALTPGMKLQGKGAILFMSSGMAYYGIAEHSIYCASKAGLLGLARGLAMELAPFGIRVNTVSPGTIDSPMLNQFIKGQGGDQEATRAAFDAMHPRGKVGSIAEVAATFVFLASDAAANITATDLRCDGGLAVKGVQPVQK